MSAPHRNSEARAEMLRARAREQRERTPGFTPMHRKPRGHLLKDYDPAGEKVDA